MSTSTATLLLITISTETKPSRSSRKGDSLIKTDRESGSTIRRTARAFRIAIKGRRRNLTGRVRRTLSNPESSIVDELNRADRISEAEPQPIAPVSPTVAARARAEEPAIVPEQASGLIRELAAARSRASIAVVARRAARASAEPPAGEAIAAAGQGLGAAAREVEAAEDDEDRLFPLSLSDFGLERNTGAMKGRMKYPMFQFVLRKPRCFQAHFEMGEEMEFLKLDPNRRKSIRQRV